jgi:hypothetical protein
MSFRAADWKVQPANHLCVILEFRQILAIALLASLRTN